MEYYIILALSFAFVTYFTVYIPAWLQAHKADKMRTAEHLGAAGAWIFVMTTIFPIMLAVYLRLGHEKFIANLARELEIKVPPA